MHHHSDCEQFTGPEPSAARVLSLEPRRSVPITKARQLDVARRLLEDPRFVQLGAPARDVVMSAWLAWGGGDGRFWTTYRRLAELVGRSPSNPSSVERALAQCEASGLLSSERHGYLKDGRVQEGAKTYALDPVLLTGLGENADPTSRVGENAARSGLGDSADRAGFGRSADLDRSKTGTMTGAVPAGGPVEGADSASPAEGDYVACPFCRDGELWELVVLTEEHLPDAHAERLPDTSALPARSYVYDDATDTGTECERCAAAVDTFNSGGRWLCPGCLALQGGDA